MAFVIRFDDPKRNPMWLRSEHPAVTWGPLAHARRYRTKAAAVSAATKLRLKLKKLVILEEPDLGSEVDPLGGTTRTSFLVGSSAVPIA
jgi:hypothetical protein